MATRIDTDPRALALARARRRPKKGTGLTRRVKAAIDALVFEGQGIEGAAAAGSIGTRALRAALLKPHVLSYYREQIAALREGERAANIRTAVEIRDSALLRKSAAGMKVRLAAAAQLDADLIDNRGGINIGVNVGVNVETPGYVIRLERKADRPQVIEHDDMSPVADHRGGQPAAQERMGGGGLVPGEAVDFEGGRENSRSVSHVLPHPREFPDETSGGGKIFTPVHVPENVDFCTGASAGTDFFGRPSGYAGKHRDARPTTSRRRGEVD